MGCFHIRVTNIAQFLLSCRNGFLLLYPMYFMFHQRVLEYFIFWVVLSVTTLVVPAWLWSLYELLFALWSGVFGCFYVHLIWRPVSRCSYILWVVFLCSVLSTVLGRWRQFISWSRCFPVFCSFPMPYICWCCPVFAHVLTSQRWWYCWCLVYGVWCSFSLSIVCCCWLFLPHDTSLYLLCGCCNSF